MSPKNPSKLTRENQQRQEFSKLFHSVKEGKIKINYIKIATENPHKKVTAIELRLRLAPKTEEKLREYVKNEFNMTLEKKLQNILIQWIGKAISNHRENKKIESKN